MRQCPTVSHPKRKLAFERLTFVYSKGIAYGYQMGLRPQTMYGIADSPVGLAAYFLDHDAWSYALISRVFAGEAAGLTRDDVLDNVTIAWLTNTAISGARLYWEYWGNGYFSVKGVSIPVAVSSFPDEIDLCPRSWAERAFPKLIHYNKLDKGGHFAAWEQPQALLRGGSRGLQITASRGAGDGLTQAGHWKLTCCFPLYSERESAVSNRRLPLTSRRLDNDRQPMCTNGVAMSRSAAPNTGQLKAVGST